MFNWNQLLGKSAKNDTTEQNRSTASLRADNPVMSNEIKIPFAELHQFEIHEASVRLLDYEYCLKNYVVVLNNAVDDNSGKPVTLGMLHPQDSRLVNKVAGKLKRDVHPVGLNAHEIIEAVDAGYGNYENILDGSNLEHQIGIVKTISLEPTLPIPEIIDNILGYAVYNRASDIHIETYEEDVDVRLRIDGILRQLRTPLNQKNVRSAVQRLKVLARLDVLVHNRAQDGRLATEYFDEEGNKKEIDFRLSILPGPYGEDAVLRILGSNTLIEMQELGLSPENLRQFTMLVENPEGLILVTGPTGSGKTTTLYSAISQIVNVERKIITVEDPIEVQFDKVNQKQVTLHMGFADFTRSFLRQDPDVILVGEIRDPDTAQVAIRAAHTGHLVLSTLHTIDSTRAITRMESLGVETDLIASTLIGVLSQRLARKICDSCRIQTPLNEVQKNHLGLTDDAGPFFTGAGCETCSGKGLKGRIGIYECFIPDEAMADMLACNTPIHKIRNTALAQGMHSLYQDAMAKARAGIIPLSEVQRTVPYRMIFESKPGQQARE